MLLEPPSIDCNWKCAKSEKPLVQKWWVRTSRSEKCTPILIDVCNVGIAIPKFKVWVKKNEILSEIWNSISYTIFDQYKWNFVRIIISFVNDVAGKSAGLNQNCGCYTILNFWECLIFLDSGFKCITWPRNGEPSKFEI